MAVAGLSGVASTAAIPAATTAAPIVNGGEHAWVLHDPRFRIDSRLATCPKSLPKHEYSAESILDLMSRNGVDKTVIIHVCYYGRDNTYATHCVKTYPDKFRAIGQLVGYRLHSPADPGNPARLERAIKEEHLVGMRLSPIYDKDIVWLNDPVCYPLWKKAQEIGAVFNVFIAPAQLPQLEDMVKRYPKVKIVVDHLGRPEILSSPPWVENDYLLRLARYPNVWVKFRDVTDELPDADVGQVGLVPFLQIEPDRTEGGAGLDEQRQQLRPADHESPAGREGPAPG